MPEQNNIFTLPTDRQLILSILNKIDGDGWTIWKTDAFDMRKELVDRFTARYESQVGNPKATIYKDGEVVPVATGIHGLRLVEGIAADLGVTSDKMGRGFRCRDLSAKILAKLTESAILE